MQPKLFQTKFFRSALTRYQRSLKNPNKVQEELLAYILNRNRKTAYGRKYNFKNINSIKEFQKRVPIVTYEELEEYVDCMLQGMKNVLVKDKVVFFATTSGTTNKPKLIPVTRTRTRQLRAEALLWMFFMMKQPHVRKGLLGKTLYFAGPFREDISQGGILMGSISGYMAWKSPVWGKTKLVFSPEIYNEMNFDKKTRMIALQALGTRNITQIGFAAPIEAILFFDYLKKNRASLIDELSRTGKKLRARQLRKLADFSPSSIWPNISLINCIKSPTNTPYLEIVQEKLGAPDLVIRDPGIYASEGRLTLGLTNYENAGVLVAQENFFEFMEQDGETYKKPITMEKIRKGKKYKVLITTQEGLYRYDIGDVLEVVDFKNKLPIVKFVQRDNFLNIVGEFSPENQLIAAMESLLKKLKISVAGYTFIPYTLNLHERPCYEVLLETKASEKQVNQLMVELDKELAGRIQDYRQMRQEFGRLGHLRIGLVKIGGYAAFDKKRLTRSGQPKPVRVAKDVSFRENFTITKEISP